MHDSVQGICVRPKRHVESITGFGSDIFIVGREKHRKLHYHSFVLRSGRNSVTSRRMGISGGDKIRGGGGVV